MTIRAIANEIAVRMYIFLDSKYFTSSTSSMNPWT